MVFPSIATPSEELQYLSDRKGRFNRSAGPPILLTCLPFEYLDPTRSSYNVLDMAKSTSTREIEVTFDGEVLRPEEPLDLEPNKTYRVRIEPAESKPASESSLRRILQLARDLGLPDLAEQHDHYLYGTPKK